MSEPPREQILIKNDSFTIPKNCGNLSGKTLICVRAKMTDKNSSYEFFDEGSFFWLSEHMCLHYLNKGAIIIKEDYEPFQIN